MMFKFLILACATLALVNGGTITKNDSKLKFSFYITSQCRDTINFVTRQLHSTYAELSDYLDVEFVPWGKSQRNGDVITCQFGPTDCVANKIQSCVLDLLNGDQAKMVDYVNCEMINLFAPSQNYQCANDVGVSTEDAKACYESEKGDELQAAAEAKTKTITMVFVPTIVYNDVYDVQVQNAAFSDFKGYVCSLLEAESPAACAPLK